MAGLDKKRKPMSLTQREDSSEEDEVSMQNEESNEDENEATVSKNSRRSIKTSRKSKSTNLYVMTKPILENFGKKCMSYFNVLPRPTFLLGSLNKEVMFTERRVRQKRDPDRKFIFLNYL